MITDYNGYCNPHTVHFHSFHCKLTGDPRNMGPNIYSRVLAIACQCHQYRLSTILSKKHDAQTAPIIVREEQIMKCPIREHKLHKFGIQILQNDINQSD